MVRGGEGESAVVKMNDVTVGMNTPLEFNCFITIEPSTAGEEAVCTIEELDEYAGNTMAFEVCGKTCDVSEVHGGQWFIRAGLL